MIIFYMWTMIVGVIYFFSFDELMKEEQDLNDFKNWAVGLIAMIIGIVGTKNILYNWLYFYVQDNGYKSGYTIVVAAFAILGILSLITIVLSCAQAKKSEKKILSALVSKQRFFGFYMVLALIIYLGSVGVIWEKREVATTKGGESMQTEVVTEQSDFELGSKYFDLITHIKTDRANINTPIESDGRFYFSTSNEELIISKGYSGKIKKIINYKAMKGSVYPRAKPIIYKDKYYIFLRGGKYVGDNRITIIDIESGEVVYEKMVKEVDGTIFELYNGKLVYGDYGINITLLDIETLEEENIFFLKDTKYILSNKHIKNYGKDSVLVNGRVYLYLDEYGDYSISLDSKRGSETSKTHTNLFTTYLGTHRKVENAMSEWTELRLIRRVFQKSYASQISNHNVLLDRTIYSDDEDDKASLMLIDRETFETMWKKVLEIDGQHRTVLTDEYLLIYNLEGTAHLLSRATGDILETLPSDIFNSGIDAYGLGDKLILCTSEGDILVLREKRDK